jgi:N-acetyl-anhydromuramyl-L-alanine amidase AmpD
MGLRNESGYLPGHGKLEFYGYMVHTTGDGIPKLAKTKGWTDLLKVANSVYDSMHEKDGTGPHWIIAPDGQTACIRSEQEIAWHCGLDAYDREMFLTTNWETNGRTPADVVSWWKRRWPGIKSPSHLYPSKSPNKNYIGIELIPAGTYNKMTWEPCFAGGYRTIGRFTTAQYLALAAITRYTLDDKPGRLVGHEDVNPTTRPGWDPGAKIGAFDWDYFLDLRRAVVHASQHTKEFI